MPISMEALKYLRHLQRSMFAKLEGLDIPKAIQPELEAVIRYDLTYLLERKLNSPDFLHMVQRGRIP